MYVAAADDDDYGELLTEDIMKHGWHQCVVNVVINSRTCLYV